MSQDYIGNIRTFETANFRVSIDAEYDYDFGFDLDETTVRQLECGELIAFQVAVTVTHLPSGMELGADYLGGCIYESIDAFQDHRACGAQNRRTAHREGRFQIYRKARPFQSCLSRGDKLKKRGFATRERAEGWARNCAKEPWEVFETDRCGSYFKDMIHEAIKEARKRASAATLPKLRASR